MKTAVRERLKKMFEELGPFTVADIVREAKRKDSPLHKEFEWNAQKAHAIYLMDRARDLIREFYIRENLPGAEESVRVREYQCLQVRGADPRDPRVYIPTTVAVGNVEYRQQVLDQALAYLSAFKRKYAHLVALAPVIRAIDIVEKRPRRASRRVSAEQPTA